MQEGESPLPFTSCESLLQQAADNKLTIAELVYRNEVSWRDEDEVDSRIAGLWSAMEGCIERGLHTEGVLPGKLSVLRRAAKLRKNLTARGDTSVLDASEWVNAYAIAVHA